MKCSSRDSKDGGEYIGIDFVEISRISVMQDAIFGELGPFDRVETLSRYDY